MKPEQIEQAWKRVLSALGDANAFPGIFDDLTALRDEMKVQSKMIDSAMNSSWLANDYFMDYHRKQAEAKLKPEAPDV